MQTIADAAEREFAGPLIYDALRTQVWSKEELYKRCQRLSFASRLTLPVALSNFDPFILNICTHAIL